MDWLSWTLSSVCPIDLIIARNSVDQELHMLNNVHQKGNSSYKPPWENWPQNVKDYVQHLARQPCYAEN